LHISSYSNASLVLEELEILDDSSDEPLAEYKGKELQEKLQHKSGQLGNRNLAGGMRAVVFIWLDFTKASAPHGLRHRLRVSAPAFARYGSQMVLGGPASVREGARVIGPPLKGGQWWAASGPSNDSGHRRTLIAVDGKARIPERFAADWARVEGDELLKGDPSKNSSYFGYGSEVLAVADATIVSMLDDLPENAPESETRAAPMTLKTMGGNYLILDIGRQQYAFYAHLQPHSIRVRVGDHVSRGQVLALLVTRGTRQARTCISKFPMQTQSLARKASPTSSIHSN
jgi:hypothetical protein